MAGNEASNKTDGTTLGGVLHMALNVNRIIELSICELLYVGVVWVFPFWMDNKSDSYETT